MSKIDMDPRTQGKVHTEQGDGRQVFIGNYDPAFIAFCLAKKWLTLRVGTTSLDKQGSLFPETLLHHLRPLPCFADRNEALSRHFELRTPRKVHVPLTLLKEVLRMNA